MALLERQGPGDLEWCRNMSEHASVIEVPPLPVREVKEFRRPYGQRNEQSVRQTAKDPQAILLCGGRLDRERHCQWHTSLDSWSVDLSLDRVEGLIDKRNCTDRYSNEKPGWMFHPASPFVEPSRSDAWSTTRPCRQFRTCTCRARPPRTRSHTNCNSAHKHGEQVGHDATAGNPQMHQRTGSRHHRGLLCSQARHSQGCAANPILAHRPSMCPRQAWVQLSCWRWMNQMGKGRSQTRECVI